MIGSEPTVAKQPDTPPEGKLTDLAIGSAFATVTIVAMAGLALLFAARSHVGGEMES